MWNWQLSALFTGASIVLYDGSPFLPTPAIMFDLIDSIGLVVRRGAVGESLSSYSDSRVAFEYYHC